MLERRWVVERSFDWLAHWGGLLRAGKYLVPHQAAVRVVKRVVVAPARRTVAEAVLVEVLRHSLMGELVDVLERQQVIAPACQDEPPLFDTPCLRAWFAPCRMPDISLG